MERGDILVDRYGGKLELLSFPSKRGLAVVKVLDAGEYLEENVGVPARSGLVIKDYDVLYGLIKYEVSDV